LAPLGYTVLMDSARRLGWVRTARISGSARPKTTVPAHIAFAAPQRATVKAFYDAAIAAGGKRQRRPGLAPRKYHPNYFGAFVLDRDGNNIEAVCRQPE